MQYLLLLFVWGATVVAAAFPPPPPPPQPGAWLSNIMLRSPWLLSPPPVTETPAEPEEEQEGVNVPYVFKPLTDEELQVYKDTTKEKCINILIASEKHGYYYNGEPFEVSGIGPPDIFYNEARIAGDRLAYVVRRKEDLQYYVVVDDEVVGRTSLIPSRSSMRIWLNLNEKHYAYIVQTDYKEKEYRSMLHLNFDGKDLGEVVVPFGFKLNGDYVIYNKKMADNVWHLYVNGKKVANGAFGDFDGKNLGYQAVGKRESDAKLVLNGKKLGYGSDLTLKDGHRAYILGRTVHVIDPKVYYDGKVVGPGREPVIEKNHLAYIRAKNEMDEKSTDMRPKVIYDGKEYGYIAGYGLEISMAGDHMAYVRLPDEYADSSDEKAPVYINIDGNDFPGVFDRNTTYVQIVEKVDRSMCANIK